MSSPQRAQRLEQDARRAQILQAAVAVFSRRSADEVSTTELAEAAGVSRGLLNHYFRTKRDLYVAAVETLVDLPAVPQPEFREGATVEQRISESVEAWLDLVERNGPAWLAATGLIGTAFGADVEAITERAGERAVDAIIAVAGLGPEARTHAEVRAVLRGFGALADALVREWLQRRRLSRAQVSSILDGALCHIVRVAIPAVINLSDGPS